MRQLRIATVNSYTEPAPCLDRAQRMRMDTTIYSDGTYFRNNPDWHVDDSAWKARHVAGILQRNAVKPASVCEIGCGAGEVLRSLSRELPEAKRFVGYDISPDAYRLCAPKA